MQNYYSHGKLLITGEYIVLDGALGLGVPTKRGQSMAIESFDQPILSWKSYDLNGNIWFEKEFNFRDGVILLPKEEMSPISSMLLKIIKIAKDLNPGFLTDSIGYGVQTALEFPRDWGLGSSSTLITNLANWAKIDAYELLKKTFDGSGYDIACAQSTGPITYQIDSSGRRIETVEFNPCFSDQLYFVHLNQKQDSIEGIAHFRRNNADHGGTISKISAITKLLIQCKSLTNFEGLISKHESLISELIQTPTIKERLFADYEGSIKSLGAWGGDFILATAKNDPIPYFSDKGYKTIIPYNEMVLK